MSDTSVHHDLQIAYTLPADGRFVTDHPSGGQPYTVDVVHLANSGYYGTGRRHRADGTPGHRPVAFVPLPADRIPGHVRALLRREAIMALFACIDAHREAAVAEDDAPVRAILATRVLPGDVTVTYRADCDHPFNDADFYASGDPVATVTGPRGTIDIVRSGDSCLESAARGFHTAAEFRSAFPDGQTPDDDTPAGPDDDDRWTWHRNAWFTLDGVNDDDGWDDPPIAHGLAEAVADAADRVTAENGA